MKSVNATAVGANRAKTEREEKMGGNQHPSLQFFSGVCTYMLAVSPFCLTFLLSDSLHERPQITDRIKYQPSTTLRQPVWSTHKE